MDQTLVTIISLGLAAIGIAVAIYFGIESIKLAKKQKALAEAQNQLAETQNNLTEQMKPKKHLIIRIHSYSPLVKTDKDAVKDLEVYYKKKLVKNVSSLQIEVSNIGNIPIKPEDYVFPVEFSVEGSFLEAYQVVSNDDSIEFLKPIQNECAQLKAEVVLLNPGDHVSINFIIAEDDNTQADKTFKTKGRLVDGTVETAPRWRIEGLYGNRSYYVPDSGETGEYQVSWRDKWRHKLRNTKKSEFWFADWDQPRD